MPKEIPTKYDDVIDSRDVIDAIERLTDTIEDAATNDVFVSRAIAEPTYAAALLADADSTEGQRYAEYLADVETLAVLQALASEAEQYAPDWQHGETLIRDSYFETYAQELAEDCDMIKRDATWPYTCIDWERAAKELQYDYMMVSFGGIDYWVR